MTVDLPFQICFSVIPDLFFCHSGLVPESINQKLIKNLHRFRKNFSYYL